MLESDPRTRSNQSPPVTVAEQVLKFILRWLGTAGLVALIFVAAPRAWMESIHSDLGMGPLPDEPIVGYLTRSLSAFYALLGGLFWVLSFDLRRQRRVLTYLGVALTALGVTLLAVDWLERMPVWWTMWEGPWVTVFGLSILLLSRRLPSEAT